MGKKYGAGPISSDQRRFFPKVGVITRYTCVFACFAYAGWVGNSIDLASSGAKSTGAYNLIRFFDFIFEVSLAKGFNIYGLKR